MPNVAAARATEMFQVTMQYICNPNPCANSAKSQEAPSQYLVPNAPRPVVRDRLVVLRLQALHRIIQEEIDENGIDTISLALASPGGRLFFCVFGVIVCIDI